MTGAALIFVFAGALMLLFAAAVTIFGRKKNSKLAVILRILSYFAMIPFILYLTAVIVTHIAYK